MVRALHPDWIELRQGIALRDAAGSEGELHDDARSAASGDRLQRFPIGGLLDCVENIILVRESLCLKLGKDKLPVYFYFEAARPSHKARHFRIGKLVLNAVGELPIAGFVSSSTAVFDSYFHLPHFRSSLGYISAGHGATSFCN